MMAKAQAYCTARQISKWLAEHWQSQHICFTEVKNGPSYGGGMRMLDFMAVKKTWSPVSICGVEIKVSRSDFVRDVKWADYLPMCNQLYWCCPAGMIKKTEIDDRCGLIWAYPDRERVRVVRRALHRDVDPDPLTLLYLILWRTEKDHRERNNRDHILRELRENKVVGDQYTRFVSQKLTEAHARAEVAILEAEHAAKSAKPVIDFLREHGHNRNLDAILEAACELATWSGGYVDRLKSARDDLDKIITAVEPPAKEEEETPQ